MTVELRALRTVPLALSFATFLAVVYLACLALALVIPDRGLHAPWLQFFAGFSWTWQGIAIGLGESIIYGFVAGLLFAPIYNFFNVR
jgi:2TM family of unknown function (DUF5676)